ncbi:MAG: hypothetical protein KC543_10540, partial [Myxococcales bacterium]|nr:hypothetical protein [Myxococcales bacterium]
MNGDGAASGEVPTPGDSDDEELRRIVAEEERVLERVLRTVRQDRRKVRGALIDYDAELIALRDQIRDARKEDLPPLIEEMERLQQVAQRRALVTEGIVDPQSPYFGRLVLEEGDRKREVLIGRSTFVDAKTGVRIVDWRDAPISRIYYRYEEGDDYDEHFGDRDVEGEVLVRRSLSVSMGRLRRVVASQGTFRRRADGTWQRAGRSATRLEGGQGAAMRPGDYHRPGQLGGGGLDREDKHLAEITALIDPRQFELITQPTSGLVVIQGGAGSGKTTIGLHRLAYLAFQDRVRFQPERMLVVVFNDALVRYIDRVLPSLGVEGVQVVTYERWAARARRRLHGDLPRDYSQDTPADAARLKKHPAIFHLLERRTATLADEAAARVRAAAGPRDGGGRALAFFRSTEGEAPAIRLRELRRWLAADGHDLPAGTRHALERAVRRGLEQVGDVPAVWAEL